MFLLIKLCQDEQSKLQQSELLLEEEKESVLETNQEQDMESSEQEQKGKNSLIFTILGIVILGGIVFWFVAIRNSSSKTTLETGDFTKEEIEKAIKDSLKEDKTFKEYCDFLKSNTNPSIDQKEHAAKDLLIKESLEHLKKLDGKDKKLPSNENIEKIIGKSNVVLLRYNSERLKDYHDSDLEKMLSDYFIRENQISLQGFDIEKQKEKADFKNIYTKVKNETENFIKSKKYDWKDETEFSNLMDEDLMNKQSNIKKEIAEKIAEFTVKSILEKNFFLDIIKKIQFTESYYHWSHSRKYAIGLGVDNDIHKFTPNLKYVENKIKRQIENVIDNNPFFLKEIEQFFNFSVFETVILGNIINIKKIIIKSCCVTHDVNDKNSSDILREIENYSLDTNNEKEFMYLRTKKTIEEILESEKIMSYLHIDPETDGDREKLEEKLYEKIKDISKDYNNRFSKDEGQKNFCKDVANSIYNHGYDNIINTFLNNN